MEVLATTVREEKEIKGIQIGKEVKLSLFADDMILHIENPKDAAKKLLELMNLVKLQDTKLIHRNLLHSYTLIMKDEKEIKETIPITITSKRIKYLGMNLPKEAKDLYQKTIRY